MSIRPANNYDLCLSVSGTPNPGSKVILQNCDNVSSQWKYWNQEGSNLILNSLCLDTLNANFANGTAVQLWNCLGNNAQTWSLNGHLCVPISLTCCRIRP